MQERMLNLVERARYVAYGLVAGLLLGMILGWIFHGFVGTLFRILIVIVILAPFVAAIIFWQRITGRNRVERMASSDDRDPVVIHESRRIRDAGTIDDSGPIRDAEWRDRP